MEINFQEQKEIFEKQREWLKIEYKKAKEDRPKNEAKLYELENRIKHFEREVNNFKKLKKDLGKE